jgi:hypothetical protein
MIIRILLRLIYVTVFVFVFSGLFSSCKKDDKADLKKEVSSVSEIRAWWEKHKKEDGGENAGAAVANSAPLPVLLSANNGAKDGAAFWAGQFENGSPQWNQARTFEIGGATIYEVPFIFPGDMQLFEDYIAPSDYPGVVPLPGLYRPTSKTYLLIKEQSGVPTVAEFMSTIITWDYMAALDNSGRSFPVVHIANVFPAMNGLGDFTGSIKFYDEKGNQRLEEKYGNGSLVQYLEYGDVASVFLMNPAPNILPILSIQTYCTTTYYSFSFTGLDGIPTVLGWKSTNCYSMGDGGAGTGGAGGGTGGGGSPRGGGGPGANYTPPPAPTINPIIKPLGACPQNFTFVPVTTHDLWQEAALTNLFMDVKMKDRFGNLENQHFNIPVFFFGLPKFNVEGQLLYSEKQAAGLASKAINEAENNTREYYRKNPALTASGLNIFWVSELKDIFKRVTATKGRASTGGSTNTTNVVVPRPYDPNLCAPAQ